MKVIIAGSRSITGQEAQQLVAAAIDASGFLVTEVLSGGAQGIDMAGLSWAWACAVPIQHFTPAYRFRGDRQAPILRNQQMVDEADALIAVWDGVSRGTADVIRRAQAKGIPVYVHRV